MDSTNDHNRRVIISPERAAKDDLVAQISRYQASIPQEVKGFPGNYIPVDVMQQGDREMLAYLDSMATLHMDDFKSTVKELARKIGVHGRDSIVFGDQKNVGNILKKANADYDGDMRQVRDVLRATIYVDDVTQVIKACTSLFSDDRFVCGKDQFRKPSGHGVRNAIGIWRINGDDEQPFHAEIQIVHSGMRDTYDKTHAAYEKKRGIERRFDEGDIDQRSMEALAQTFAQQAKLQRAVKSTHDQAADAAGLNVLLMPEVQSSFTSAVSAPSSLSPVAQSLQQRGARHRQQRKGRNRGKELGIR